MSDEAAQPDVSDAEFDALLQEFVGQPSGPEMACPITRETKSAPPPGVLVTKRTGLTGKTCPEPVEGSCAHTAVADAASSANNATARPAIPRLLCSVNRPGCDLRVFRNLGPLHELRLDVARC